MDSDDSRDDVSSGSDSESNVKGPRSPNSIQSADSQDYKSRQSPRGPRSPSPCGPRSPSPEGSVQSNSPINSPKRDTRSPLDDRYNDTIKSPSAHSLSSQGDDNTRNSMKSNLDEEDGNESPKSTSSHSSAKSRSSVKSRSSIKSRNSVKSRSSVKSRDSIKSRSSVKSRDSIKSRESIKSPSPVRRTPMSPKSPDNSPARSVNSYKSPERRGPMSPPPEDGNTSDSSVSSRESHGSRGSRRSLASRGSRTSLASRGSRSSRRSRGSQGSRNSRRNKSNDRLDAQAEEISDGDMEYEGGKDSDDEIVKLKPNENAKINLSHEDLSDVSDLDSLGGNSEDETRESAPEKSSKPPVDLRQKLDEAKNRKMLEKQNNQNPPEKTSKTEDGEEQLDFEAEDGECVEEAVKAKPAEGLAQGVGDEEEGAISETGPEKEKEEVEEGEVTDDDEVRPEETEPRPVCRFYSRGQCTWGASCRFLHPGVTDKGNYTMFELIRPMVPGGPAFGPQDERFERPGFGIPPVRGEPPVVESAWERGLRTAKEMMRKAIKRKEQDMDFEEKKMNLTLTQDELDKENGYYTRAASPIPVEPVPRHFAGMRHPLDYRQAEAAKRPDGGGDHRRRQVSIEKNRHLMPVSAQARVPEEYYSRRVVYESEPRVMRMEPEFEVPRERVRSYRELPAHRMPDYYNDKYEEPVVTPSRRPKREVIVQRIEPAGGGRGDEWADPWMRSKSPSGRGKSARFGGTRRQSFSSASTYSSSSSSRSSSGSTKSTYRGDSRSRSRSPTSRVRRRGPGPKSPSHRIHRTGTRAVSPSVIVSEKKAANERALLMNPPAPSPKKAHKDNRPPSPGMMRTSSQNPPAPTKGLTDQYGRTRDRSKHESERKKLAVAAALAASVKSRARMSRSSSGSDSSGSSSSDSESSYSSSSSSRDGSPSSRRKVSEKVELAAMALKAKALDALKSGGDKRQIKLNLKSNTLKPKDLSELARKAGKEDILQGKKRLASSPPDGDGSTPKIAAVGKNAANNKKSTSRREELLKQLKAVEDAIAKKRSKIN